MNLRENTTVIFTYLQKSYIWFREIKGATLDSLVTWFHENFSNISKIDRKVNKQHLSDCALKEEFFKLLVYIVAALFHYDFSGKTKNKQHCRLFLLNFSLKNSSSKK